MKQAKKKCVTKSAKKRNRKDKPLMDTTISELIDAGVRVKVDLVPEELYGAAAGGGKLDKLYEQARRVAYWKVGV